MVKGGKKRFEREAEDDGFSILVTHSTGLLAQKAEKRRRRCVFALFERVKKRARSASPSLIG